MKKRLIDLLVCPTCKTDLDVNAELLDAEDIVEGTLGCGRCGARYAIRRGIPRFVEDGSYAESFGYEWHRFRPVQIDSANQTRDSETAFRAKTGLAPEQVRDRLVLDVGVGAGRYAEVVAGWGAEVVGVDLTRAVDAAAETLRGRPNVYLIQADVFALPFRDGAVDIAYSVGVLHHTPDTAAAFERVAATVKPGGQLAVYVYHAGGLARYASDAFRRLTTRMPRELLYAACFAAGPLYYAHRLPFVGRALQTVLPISLDPRWRWRQLDTFDWYSPRYQWKHTYPEVFRWFRELGFNVVHVADEPICMRGVKA